MGVSKDAWAFIAEAFNALSIEIETRLVSKARAPPLNNPNPRKPQFSASGLRALPIIPRHMGAASMLLALSMIQNAAAVVARI